MDPATAFAMMVKAVAEMITEIVRGQPQDVREKAWRRWEADMDRWRRFFGVDAEDPKKSAARRAPSDEVKTRRSRGLQ